MVLSTSLKNTLCSSTKAVVSGGVHVMDDHAALGDEVLELLGSGGLFEGGAELIDDGLRGVLRNSQGAPAADDDVNAALLEGGDVGEGTLSRSSVMRASTLSLPASTPAWTSPGLTVTASMWPPIREVTAEAAPS